jgi:hypothetical protein
MTLTSRLRTIFITLALGLFSGGAFASAAGDLDTSFNPGTGANSSVSTLAVQADGDGIGNNADWDDDNDGVPDTVDAAPLDASNTSEIVLLLDGSYKGMHLQNNATH